MLSRTQTEAERRTAVARTLTAVALTLTSVVILLTAREDPFQDPYEEYYEVRAAAEQGDAAAQYALGRMYHNGEGVPQDYAEALRWFNLSAGQGQAEAQYALELMHDFGEGVLRDHAEAVGWYRAAAEQGYWAAQNNLGVMYKRGDGVPQDHVLAHMWFSLAASGAPDADMRGLVISARNEVEILLTPEQIAEAQRRAREWTENHRQDDRPVGAAAD